MKKIMKKCTKSEDDEIIGGGLTLAQWQAEYGVDSRDRQHSRLLKEVVQKKK